MCEGYGQCDPWKEAIVRLFLANEQNSAILKLTNVTLMLCNYLPEFVHFAG